MIGKTAMSTAAAARKSSRRLGADLRVSVARSSMRERVAIVIFLLVPFIVAALFVQHVVIPRQPVASGAADQSASTIQSRRETRERLLRSRLDEQAVDENGDDDQILQDDEDMERVFLEGIGTSDTIERIRKTRLQRRARQRERQKRADDVVYADSESADLEEEQILLESSTPHVSLVASCRDRSSALLQALGTWLIALDDDDELILVDWSTDERLLSVATVAELAGNDDRVMTVTAADQHDWILSRAYNLAARLASGRNLLKVDCDTLLEPGFLAAHPLDNGEEDGQDVFYKTAWQAARDENEVHLNGVFYVKRTRFLDAHGYDERLTTYGWDDSDLYERLEQAGLRQKVMRFDMLHHLSHSDDAREANQDTAAILGRSLDDDTPEKSNLGTGSISDDDDDDDIASDPSASVTTTDPMLATQVSRYTTDFALRWLMPRSETYNFDHQLVAFRVVMLSLAENSRSSFGGGSSRDAAAAAVGTSSDSESASVRTQRRPLPLFGQPQVLLAFISVLLTKPVTVSCFVLDVLRGLFVCVCCPRQINSLAVRELAPWGSEANAHESQYFFRVLSDDFSRLEANSVRSPPSVMEQLPEATRRRIRRTAEQRVLHDAYGVPWDVISQLDSARGDLLIALRAIHAAANSRWGRGLGLIFAEISGSPAERLLSLASAMGLAAERRRPLVITWSAASSKSGESVSPSAQQQNRRGDATASDSGVDSFNEYFDEKLSSVSHEQNLLSPDKRMEQAEAESVRLFVLREWKCRERLDVCMDWDKAYGRVVEFTTGRDESVVQRAIAGEIRGKHHLLLRLSMGLNLVSKAAKVRALAALVPSGQLVRRVHALSSAVSGSLGVYIGAGLKQKALVAVAQRIARQAKARKVGVFAIGENDDDVREVRSQLGELAIIPPDNITSSHSSMREGSSADRSQAEIEQENEKDELHRRLAELYALGIFCKDVVNDGKLPVAIAQLVDLFRDVRSHRK